MSEIIGKLVAADYWEWRTTVTELQLAKSEAEKEVFKIAAMEKDLEIGKLRLSLYRRSLENVQNKVSLAQAEYTRFTSLLEQKMNISLKDCVINDVTFEVQNIKE